MLVKKLLILSALLQLACSHQCEIWLLSILVLSKIDSFLERHLQSYSHVYSGTETPGSLFLALYTVPPGCLIPGLVPRCITLASVTKGCLLLPALLYLRLSNLGTLTSGYLVSNCLQPAVLPYVHSWHY